MRDGDIRQALRAKLDASHAGDKDTLIRNELGLCMGETRVDLAVINEKLAGYEIKSARDTLKRLPSQVVLYGRVLDEAHIVASSRHAERVFDHVPDWWGVMHAEPLGDKVVLRWLRRGTRNTAVDPYAIAQLLWRDEALDVLRQRNLHSGLCSATRFVLWDKLAESLALRELRDAVRHRLMERRDWSGG